MYVPHPGIETPEKATQALKAEFSTNKRRQHIHTYVAAFHAQQEAENGRIPG
jgi:hypothetical protein